MFSHSILVMSLRKFVIQIDHWYEYSLLHQWFSVWSRYIRKQRESSRVIAWSHSFFELLAKSRVYHLLKLLIQGINTMILWSYERLVNLNSNSVLLTAMNNFGSKETRAMSFLLVFGGFGFGLLVNFILKRQVAALFGLVPLVILVASLLGARELKINVKESYLYQVFKRGLKLFRLDQEEI